ncbi:MAG: hypothetical protein AB7D57_01165 [Desulfovibrionaceae bacterium]
MPASAMPMSVASGTIASGAVPSGVIPAGAVEPGPGRSAPAVPTLPTPLPDLSDGSPAARVGRASGVADACRGLRALLQHHCNPLHVFCKLRALGLGPGPARALCRVYERCLYRHVLFRPLFRVRPGR